MTRDNRVLERLRAANPAPSESRIDPDELSIISSLLKERRGAMTTQTPIRPPVPTEEGRRWPRPALAFGLAILVVAVAVGVGVFLSGGGEEVIMPSETTTPTQTTAPTQTTQPSTTTTAVASSPATPVIDWNLADIQTGIDADRLSVSPIGFLLGTENGLFVSSDGSAWSRVPDAPQGVIEYVAYHDGAYVALAAQQDAVGNLLDSVAWTSVDGLSWDRHETFDLGVWALNAGESGFVAVGMDDEPPIAAISFSEDGETWTRIPNMNGLFDGLESGASWVFARDVAWGPPGYVVIGEDDFTSGDVKAAVWFSPDGLTWQRVEHDEPVFGIPDTEDWYSMIALTYGDHGYVAVGVIDGPDIHTGAVWHSVDGVNWSLQTGQPDLGGSVFIEDVTGVGGGYLAVGSRRVAPGTGDGVWSETAATWFSPDGTEWIQLPTEGGFAPDGEQVTLRNIAINGDHVVVLGYREEPATAPPAEDPDALDWIGRIWYGSLGWPTND